ncbi:hypothetical protein EW146_g8478 [Bondarzewia mesenterica]|uniref:Acylamino-acid-releasing enzyme N-terminal domain-containing protein n=1 Tax=Bondarzewia mesenterica TaxID=1095465 RepID=A0A4S4LEK2_9AGAM|nr:hypothetical protein EW146_g8478 [Bondarzewia mesenterica]
MSMGPHSFGDASGSYVELAGIPVYTAAQFLTENVVSVTSSTKDHTRNVKRSSSKTIFIRPKLEPKPGLDTLASLPQDVSPDVQASIISPSGKLTAILRETSNGSNGAKNRYVEIWARDKLEASTDVSKLHGPFYTDDYFSSLSFSPSETTLVYTAEANAPELADPDPFARFRYLPDFGESLTGRKRPTLNVFQWQPRSAGSEMGNLKGNGRSTVKPLVFREAIPTQVAFGQAVFAADDRIIATGYELTEDGHRLGVKGCLNRPAGLWELILEPSSLGLSEDNDGFSNITASSATRISHPGRSSRSPRVYRDAASDRITVFWLSNELGGPHAACSSLHSFDMKTRQSTLLLDTVFEAKAQKFW